ncbi:2-dehydropantoate 2-reductase [Nocardia otitidiscaviarum]|uniref:2-dehydropantoate 2-reductase n=1 Tax=Nocardia otitidiscaviarum TaxID=1823 RepID=A0A516NKH0_9NOCA|nr:2-dehydropantoate 2-reductase [Nocardia otitidiscaviarum]MCP9618614.1 2-dehydropantoate 2-reductase [Nocardia otitidiscaviarum]QDP79403.1 2-dehydropantoate 2-reductase [Nocardia otitidiscaviarum]
MTCRVLVLGAGSIGSYVGGALAAAGADVTFVGRPRLLDELRASGLRLTDLDGRDERVAPDAFRTATSTAGVDAADLVLICVKSRDTASAAAELAGRLAPGTVVVSLQNGIGNDTVIRELLPTCVVLPGMVMFNVVHHGDGRFHRGTAGGIAVADDPALDRFRPVLDRSRLGVRRYPDLLPVQWAKLLLNLNNPINALSGRPLREQLAQRDYRRCLALAQREALRAMARARIRPARLTALPPELMARLLTVPDAVFTRVAGTVLAVDPVARSSMADDLAAGRSTEIAWLSGEIVSLGKIVGMPTPVNQRLVELITAAENGDRRTWSGAELLAELGAAADRSVVGNIRAHPGDQRSNQG